MRIDFGLFLWNFQRAGIKIPAITEQLQFDEYKSKDGPGIKTVVPERITHGLSIVFAKRFVEVKQFIGGEVHGMALQVYKDGTYD